MRSNRLPSLLLLLLATLGGCTMPLTTPSLAPRPIEREPVEPPAEAAEAETAADAGLAGRIAPLVAAAETAQAAFEEERAATTRAVERARGTATGGERWLQAQQALSALEARRAGVRDAVQAVEALRQEPANAAPGNRAAIEAAAARIEALDEAQAATLAELSRALG